MVVDPSLTVIVVVMRRLVMPIKIVLGSWGTSPMQLLLTHGSVSRVVAGRNGVYADIFGIAVGNGSRGIPSLSLFRADLCFAFSTLNDDGDFHGAADGAAVQKFSVVICDLIASL